VLHIDSSCHKPSWTVVCCGFTLLTILFNGSWLVNAQTSPTTTTTTIGLLPLTLVTDTHFHNTLFPRRPARTLRFPGQQLFLNPIV